MRRDSAVRLRLGAAALVIALVGIDRVVWQPPTDPAERTDVVVVLGGSNDPERLDVGAGLARRFGVPLLVSSGATRNEGCDAAGETPDGSACFVPDPFTTQGEARFVAAATRARGWRSVTVVVSTDQVSRARLRFSRCGVPGLRLVSVPLAYKSWIYATAYELAAGAKAEILQRGC